MNVSAFTNNHVKNIINAFHHENKNTVLTVILT